MLLTDDGRDADWIEAVSQLPRGSGVIVRARKPDARQRLALELKKCAARRGVLVFVADDPKLAIRIRAAGLHAPDRFGLAVCQYRATMRSGVVTAAAHGPAGLSRAARLHADGALLSPLYPTSSHPGKPALGAMRWGLVRRTSTLCVIALGGVDSSNVRSAMSLGAQGVAVIGSWLAPVRS